MSEEYAIQLKPKRGDWKVLDARYYDLNEALNAARIIRMNFSRHKVIVISRPRVVWSVVDEGGVK